MEHISHHERYGTLGLEHGTVWFAPIPRCPTHGQMSYDMPTDTYVCRGYDGEGCEYKVPMEDLWSPLGTTEEDPPSPPFRREYLNKRITEKGTDDA